MIFYILSALLMAVTAFLHSYFGEKRLLGPLFASKSSFLENPRGRRILRTSWHWQSGFMLSNAVVVAWPGIDEQLKLAIGLFWVAMGLQSLIRSRGKHVCWASLLGAGVFALIGALA